MQTTPLLLPAPEARWCCLCNMALAGKPFNGRGFVVVPYSGRAYCASCLETQMPTRLDAYGLAFELAELDEHYASLAEIVEAAQHVRVGTLRLQIVELALELSGLAERLTSASAQTCAVCGCWQDDDGVWHEYNRGLACEWPKRSRVWLADDLCSHCLGQHTVDNTLVGQCDCCHGYSSRLIVRGDSQWANCPDCFAKSMGRFSAARKEAR